MSLSCCDPCPWCGMDVDVDEVEVGSYDDPDWAWYHWCPDKENCGWNDSKGR